VGQWSRTRSQGQIFWYGWKGSVTKKACVNYESPKSHGLKVTNRQG